MIFCETEQISKPIAQVNVSDREDACYMIERHHFLTENVSEFWRSFKTYSSEFHFWVAMVLVVSSGAWDW